MTSLASRQLTAIITAGPATDGYVPPTFGTNKQNTVTISGRQISAEVSYCLQAMAEAQISITGMSLSDMNEIQSLGEMWFAENRNMVSLLAGDAVSGMSLVFQGNLNTAFIDTTNAPNVALSLQAMNGIGPSLVPVPPSSFQGAVNVATVMQQLAAPAGLDFQNNGVSAVISNPYLPGTALDQIRECAEAAGINFTLEKGGKLGTLVIWPRSGSRLQSAIPLVSPQTGLNGYPTYTNWGVNFRTLFNPNLIIGGQVQLQSSLKPACGIWYVTALDHLLDSLTADGNWWTDVTTSRRLPA